jgi:hypothetical protein
VANKKLGAILIVLGLGSPVAAQVEGESSVPPPAARALSDEGGDGAWRAAEGAGPRGETSPAAEGATLEAHQVRPAAPAPVQSFGKGTLPNDQGQVWQEYDISVYTSKVQGTEHPEQAVIDWILRETGTEVWFTQPLGVLNANAKTVRVYHTPEMQRIVADVVGRFVNGTQDPHVLGLRVVAVDHPNWRATFLNRLRPIAVQSAGIDAWLVSKEDAAVLLAELRRRIDFREHAATSLVFHNGQSQTVAQLRPRAYVRSFRARTQDNSWMGYDMERGQIQEGFTLQVSPLLSPDERTIDAVLKCGIDQVERLVPVGVDLPGFTGQMQRAEIQVPQLVSWRLHERFRWPTSHVLLLGCGVIASPGPDRPSALGLSNLLGRGGGRCEALLFVESLGKTSQAVVSGGGMATGGGVTPPGSRY